MQQSFHWNVYNPGVRCLTVWILSNLHRKLQYENVHDTEFREETASKAIIILFPLLGLFSTLCKIYVSNDTPLQKLINQN